MYFGKSLSRPGRETGAKVATLFTEITECASAAFGQCCEWRHLEKLRRQQETVQARHMLGELGISGFLHRNVSSFHPNLYYIDQTRSVEQWRT